MYNKFSKLRNSFVFIDVIYVFAPNLPRFPEISIVGIKLREIRLIRNYCDRMYIMSLNRKQVLEKILMMSCLFIVILYDKKRVKMNN